jgi:hypothetical protein
MSTKYRYFGEIIKEQKYYVRIKVNRSYDTSLFEKYHCKLPRYNKKQVKESHNTPKKEKGGEEV